MILSDNEITLLCEGERPMIAPFQAQQINTNEQGARLLSYGVSSYGYDVQLAEKFQIFSNQDATLIDPKRLDPHSLKDAKIHVDPETQEKYAILPPHSYGLSYTKQYLQIPNDVLVICLGKSTYARCFTGDTRIALADGTNPTFLEAINRVKAGEKLFGYSVDNELNIVITELVAPRKIGNEKIFEVELDSGDIIRCTEDHKFITRDGLEIEAKDLHEGDSLFPFYRRETPKGYLQIAQPESWTFDFAEATAKFYGAAVNENHKVIAVRETDTFEDVYCLTASEFGNFALDAGVFVLNCGIHTNVTPLEPGWCGNVVIEISNSTSLPVKIYLDEGIAQFVFLRGKACRTSYADRNGKYQGQEGITLARV